MNNPEERLEKEGENRKWTRLIGKSKTRIGSQEATRRVRRPM
jgi:hypothetical protein